MSGIGGAHHQTMSVSQILKTKQLVDEDDGGEGPKKKSREDWRKAKELEEARKAGTAPAAVDEEGKDINPHIPQYISTAPWYYGTSGPTLKHQRPQDDKQEQYSELDEWYKRGVDTSKVVTKYRKGACENCGAMTHKRKECMERPRKVGAKFTQSNIAPDEFKQKTLSLSYDGKRDRWSGYDPSEHRTIIEEFQKVEEAKRQLKADKLNTDLEDQNPDDNDDEDKYVDEVDMPGTKVDSKQRITVRNLRIREDTAKYLRNLDPNSAYYDPKTRSMRENPNPAKDDIYSGENFVRFTGDTTKHATAQLFAWEAYEKGVDVHLLAEPTKLEMLQKEFNAKREQFETTIQANVLAKYGGEEHLKPAPQLAQSEAYVEYERMTGKVIKGEEKKIVRSKYEEDVMVNNHTSVWGSFWSAGRWGYKCCCGFIKNSYCLGEAGIQQFTETSSRIPESSSSGAADDNSEKKPTRSSSASSESSSSSSSPSSSSDSEDEKESKKSLSNKKKKRLKRKERRREKRKAKKLQKQKKTNGKDGDDDLKAALEREENEKRRADALLAMDERKRPYNSMYEAKKPSEADMEAYLLKRRREEDPMNNF